MYDFGARFQDPSLGRWFVVDALAAHPNQIDKSPYAYAWNNPIYYTDPDRNCPLCDFLQDYFMGVSIGHRNFINNTIEGAKTTVGLGALRVNSIVTRDFETFQQVNGAQVQGAAEGMANTVMQPIQGVIDVANGKTVEGFAKLAESSDQASVAVLTEGILRGVPVVKASKSTAPSVAEQVITEAKRVNPDVNTTTLTPDPYAGKSIPARSKSQSFTAAERRAINEIGETTGCHTCGATSSGWKSGNFTLDHQPVSSLVPDGTPQVLYPHCSSCSPSQGGITGGLIRRGYDSSKINYNYLL